MKIFKYSDYKKVVFIIFILYSIFLPSQQKDTWFAFYSNEYFDEYGDELIGFKNRQGEVVIEPQFSGFIIANKFDDIITVSKIAEGPYYLVKNGKEFGRDSVYFFDTMPDCESEGFIKFEDRKIDRVGFFNKQGKAVIPAIYNETSSVKNGMFIGLTGAHRECLDNVELSRCEHSVLVGGEHSLVDTLNTVLIKDFKVGRNLYLDYYSIQVEDLASKESDKVSFLGENGKYYIFVDYEKQFKSWLSEIFLKNMSKENWNKHSLSKIMYIKNKKEKYKPVGTFMNKHYKDLYKEFSAIVEGEVDYFISPEIYFVYPIISIDDSIEEDFEKYRDNCRYLNTAKYPKFNLITNRNKKEILSQNIFEFLKTEDGYKLISITRDN